MQINLLSDTVTKPTRGMLEAMMTADVGDDVFSQDPTINKLQKKAAELFGHESALFCPSGTMTNQIAIQLHTKPLEEILCDYTSHIFHYELGGYSFHARVAINPIHTANGKLTPTDIHEQVRPVHELYPTTRLVVIENTCNKAGGNYYTWSEMDALARACKEHNLKFHLDGARIFNALTESGDSPLEVGKIFDSISICISKGLGAPVGSLLIGNQADITRARKIRKVMGGGMRQAGYLAAAGIYALDHHITRLKEDHHHAQLLASAMQQSAAFQSVVPVYTNIVIGETIDPADQVVAALADRGLLSVAIDRHKVRLVTHLDVNQEMIQQACKIIKNLPGSLSY